MCIIAWNQCNGRLTRESPSHSLKLSGRNIFGWTNKPIGDAGALNHGACPKLGSPETDAETVKWKRMCV